MVYHIADYIIDTSQYCITGAGELIAVEPKVFDLIVYFILNRDRLISREELFDEIWEGREVSDTSLSNHVKSARKVFGDNGDLQSFIKTVRGRGYQFIAEVVELPMTNTSHTKTHQNELASKPIRSKLLSDSAASHPRFWPTKLIALVTVFLCLAFFVGWRSQESSSPTVEDSRPYILVAPFDISGGDQTSWEPFADQITREVIRNLRQISGLRVVPPPSAFTFKENKIRSHIRSQLPEVRYVLDAVVNIVGQNDIRITLELEDLNSGDLLWDNDYLSRIDDTNFFAVQAKIASAVSASLEVLILEDEQKALGTLPTSDLIAYELYIAGRQQLDLFSQDSMRRSIALFSEAIALDAEFDAAYIAKADAYRMLMTYFEIPIDMLPNVVDSVAEALSINPDSAEARSSLGLAYVFAWRWEDAWNMLSEARARDPDLALTELGFALYYSGLGDVDGVKRSLARANQLDPLNTELADWGQWALAIVGETDEAIAWGQEKIRQHPNIGILYSGASTIALIAGDYQRALSLAEEGAILEQRAPMSLILLAQAYGAAGQTNKIQPLLDEAERQGRYMCPYETAVTYLLLDEIDKTFEHLNKAVSLRSNCLIFTRNDPRLEPIRNDPRFSALLTRVGLDQESLSRYPR